MSAIAVAEQRPRFLWWQVFRSKWCRLTVNVRIGKLHFHAAFNAKNYEHMSRELLALEFGAEGRYGFSLGHCSFGRAENLALWLFHGQRSAAWEFRGPIRRIR